MGARAGQLRCAAGRSLTRCALRRAVAAEAAAREERDVSLRLRARLREQHAEATALKGRNEDLADENAHLRCARYMLAQGPLALRTQCLAGAAWLVLCLFFVEIEGMGAVADWGHGR